MRPVKKTPGKSLAIGDIPEGCKRCVAGQKSILFVTGRCNQRCPYCTISKKRWQKDDVWVNEKLVENDNDLIEEVKTSESKGIGITGGEPLLVPELVIHYIKILKENFGKNFHIHIYTSGLDIDPKILKRLYNAGLDEIRIHMNKEFVIATSKFNWKFGMEVPVIPGDVVKLCRLVDFLEEVGADHLNLNELEFSERNLESLGKYDLRKDSLSAVEGSEETAKQVLGYARKNTKKLNVHYCTAALKMNYQLKNRLKNRAKNIKKPFEKVTKDGLLLKGIIIGDKRKIKLKLKEMKVKDSMFFEKEKRIEVSVKTAEKISKNKEFKVAIVEEYPTADPWDFELTPLN